MIVPTEYLTKSHVADEKASLAPFYYISFFLFLHLPDMIRVSSFTRLCIIIMIHTYESNEQRQGHNFSNKVCHLSTKYNCYVSHAKSAKFLAALVRDYIL